MENNLDHESGQTQYINWDFRPYLPVRPFQKTNPHMYLRENVFIRQWQRLMARYALEPIIEGGMMREDRYFVEHESWRYPVLEIFEGFKPSVHDTRIASNFILFLGRNNGVSYLDSANRLANVFASAHHSKPDAYIAQWGLENNVRAQFMQASAPARYSLCKTDQGELFYEPRYRDIKTLENMAYWCGTDKGQSFIQSCEQHLQAIRNRSNVMLKKLMLKP